MLTSLRRASIVIASSGSTRSIRYTSVASRYFGSSSGSPKSDDQTTEKSSQSTSEKAEEDISADSYSKAMDDLKNVENSAKDLHRQLLLKYANAENTRRERLEEVRRRDAQHISKFGEKVSTIYESLDKVCELAKAKAESSDADEKVKSLAEGLIMTRGIMKNILSKHGIMNGSK